METIDEMTLIQIFTCGNKNTFTYSNFHLIPLQSKKNVVESKLVYFGLDDMKENLVKDEPTPDPDPTPDPQPTQKKTYPLYNGFDFFKAADWKKASDINDSESYGDSILDTDGNLSFDNNTSSRIELFHVGKRSTDKGDVLIHPADNGTNDLSSILNTEYTYTMKMKVNGEMDMGILAAKKANGKDVKQNAFYLTFRQDGSLTFSQQANSAANAYLDRYTTGQGLFVQGKEFEFKITMNRVDKDTLKMSFSIDSTALTFQGEEFTSGAISCSFDENGVFTSKNYLSTNGMGQRLSILPKDDTSKIVISSLAFSSKKVEEPTEDQTETIEDVTIANPSNMPNGTDFFSSENWKSSDSAMTARNDSQIKNGENLVFTKDNMSRIDLFHVVKNAAGNYVHLADSGNANSKGKFNEEATQAIFSNTYRFDFDIQATSSFDMMLFRSQKAFARNSAQNSFFLNVSEDGSLTLRMNGPANQFHLDGIYQAASTFKMNQVNRFTLFARRNSASKLTLKIAVNNKVIKLAKNGDFAYDDSKTTITLSKDGEFILEGLLDQYGLGQRFGIYAIDDAQVTLSKFGYSMTSSN